VLSNKQGSKREKIDGPGCSGQSLPDTRGEDGRTNFEKGGCKEKLAERGGRGGKQ